MAPGFQAAALANTLGLYNVHGTPDHALRVPGYLHAPPVSFFLRPFRYSLFICLFHFHSS